MRTFVEALPCLAEQPTFVGCVLEARALCFLLGDKVHLVVRQVHQVHSSILRCLTYHLEPQTMLDLLYTRWSRPVAMYTGVLALTPTTVVVARAVFLRDFTRKVMYRVFVLYFCYFIKI